MEYKLYQGDCLEEMSSIEDNSVDLILTDLPYGTTSCKWDIIIPFDRLWEQYKRVIAQNKTVILFGDEPFSSALRMSNLGMYKYDLYWRKSRPAGFVNAKLKPLKDIETISVFSECCTANGSNNNMVYNPQGLIDCDTVWSRPSNYLSGDRGVSPARKNNVLSRKIEKTGYPRQVLDFPNSNKNLLHPTQKPVELLEWLIKTYSNEGDVVLDSTMGSGSTGVACMNTNRRFIGIEKDEKYFAIAKERIESMGIK